MTLLRVVAIPTGLTNTVAMVMWGANHNLGKFLIAWAGACLAFYAALLLTEEQHMTVAGYLDLAARIRWEIKEQGMLPGDRLPTTAQLADRFDTTRTTVHRALRVLEQENILRAVQGRGVYVVGVDGAAGYRMDKKKDRIEQHIRAAIAGAPPGAPMPDTASLSNLFHVHPITVRRVQAGLVDQGLLKRSRNGNYFKA